LLGSFKSISELAKANPEDFISGKKTKFEGVGPDSLRKFHDRAKLLSTPGAKPYLKSTISLPKSLHEIFFDVEVDPMRGICYLHGFVERKQGEAERYLYFFANSPSADDEKRAFVAAFAYLKSSESAVVYYYSKYERTIYRDLQEAYPDVCSRQDVDRLFDPSRFVDLYYDVVLKATEWPTRDFSLKTLASFLGFGWRDPHPVKTGNPEVKRRILEYNEDDCRATRVLLDGIRAL